MAPLWELYLRPDRLRRSMHVHGWRHPGSWSGSQQGQYKLTTTSGPREKARKKKIYHFGNRSSPNYEVGAYVACQRGRPEPYTTSVGRRANFCCKPFSFFFLLYLKCDCKNNLVKTMKGTVSVSVGDHFIVYLINWSR